MPRNLQTSSNEVHLWSATVDTGAAFDKSLAILADDERARAKRFAFERDRVRFVTRRAFARTVVASYIGVAASQVRFRTSPLGKRELDPACGVFYNASHSDGLAIVAVAHERLVGVDIERVRPIADALELAHRLFSVQEVRRIRSVSEASRTEAFLTIWTRKESYVKSVGAGLSIPLHDFDVSTLDASRTGRPRGPHGDLPFVIASLEAHDGYVGAVTVSGTQVLFRHMNPSPMAL